MICRKLFVQVALPTLVLVCRHFNERALVPTSTNYQITAKGLLSVVRTPPILAGCACIAELSLEGTSEKLAACCASCTQHICMPTAIHSRQPGDSERSKRETCTVCAKLRLRGLMAYVEPAISKFMVLLVANDSDILRHVCLARLLRAIGRCTAPENAKAVLVQRQHVSNTCVTWHHAGRSLSCTRWPASPHSAEACLVQNCLGQQSHLVWRCCRE